MIVQSQLASWFASTMSHPAAHSLLNCSSNAFFWAPCFRFLRVEITIQRKAEKLTLNRKQREGMKAREIYQKYPKAKAEQLMRSLKERNLWYWDPDFDQDEEDWLGSRSGPIPEMVFDCTGLLRGSPIGKKKGLFGTIWYDNLSDLDVHTLH